MRASVSLLQLAVDKKRYGQSVAPPPSGAKLMWNKTSFRAFGLSAWSGHGVRVGRGFWAYLGYQRNIWILGKYSALSRHFETEIFPSASKTSMTG
ncbi:hypothetical protein [Mesorhizobium sp. M8A.F.Ca.ET.165.01.1.1]|uniref:hypothetical protein n=1 Tax=Mesorhizobium sp. M8A.F.Ca.ET.165.01.1.1 TaxID=2563960 RepID=UPI001AEF2A7B|nr:hypothetical protein [Mesorhizobium sp. M8A.F.Ca.ET.165.01.1.1]